MLCCRLQPVPPPTNQLKAIESSNMRLLFKQHSTWESVHHFSTQIVQLFEGHDVMPAIAAVLADQHVRFEVAWLLRYAVVVEYLRIWVEQSSHPTTAPHS